jgi:hypothetical protein
MTPTRNTELGKFEGLAGNAMLYRRALLEGAGVFAGALGTGVRLNAAAAAASSFDARAEAKKIAYDRIGHGEKVLLISGFPQTRRSWKRLIPLLSSKFETIPADLPELW